MTTELVSPFGALCATCSDPRCRGRHDTLVEFYRKLGFHPDRIFDVRMLGGAANWGLDTAESQATAKLQYSVAMEHGEVCVIHLEGHLPAVGRESDVRPCAFMIDHFQRHHVEAAPTPAAMRTELTLLLAEALHRAKVLADSRGTRLVYTSGIWMMDTDNTGVLDIHHSNLPRRLRQALVEAHNPSTADVEHFLHSRALVSR